MIQGWVSDIQRFSLHDGPGIRTIVFLKGCPLNCSWCSNPESKQPEPEVMFHAVKCIRCGTCVEVCPKNAITLKASTLVVNREQCDGCGRCAEECPTGALKMSGELMSIGAVIEEIEKDRGFYRSSGGGLTVSGGEPLSQPRFLQNLLSESKARGIHTAVETSGHAPWEEIESIIPFTDLFLFDLKHIDPGEHTDLSGYDNQLILENLELICKKGAQVIPRMPVIPGINDASENLDATAGVITNLGLKEIHLLPYHLYGTGKYTMLGIEYPLAELEGMSEEALEPAKAVFESQGLTVSIGGE